VSENLNKFLNNFPRTCGTCYFLYYGEDIFHAFVWNFNILLWAYSDISNLRSCDKKNSDAVKVEIFYQVIMTVFRRAAALIGTLSFLEEIFSDS